MNIQARQLIHAAIIMLIPCFLVLVFVISTQSSAQINFLDNFWYLNRARLIWQGTLPDLFVYALSYPVVVGALDLVVKDVILSAMITNTVLLWCALVGVYILGEWLFGRRRISWLAVVLMLFNAYLFDVLRLFWATLPFMTAVVWSVIACIYVIRRPTIGKALLLGAILALATYTRVEGTMYAIFIPIASAIVYRQRRDLRLALTIFFTAGLVFAVLCIPFALNFIYVNRNIDHEVSDAVTGIISLVNRTPIAWSIIWRRMTDTLTGMLSIWPMLAWIVVIAGVIWASPRIRTAQWICVALIGFNVFYTFVLAIWPGTVHIVFFIPFFALILAATLDQLLEMGRWSRYIAQLLCVLVMLPGVSHLGREVITLPVMAYRTSDLAVSGRALDEWLTQKGLEKTHIYTFCSSIPSFSRADFQLIYRLQFTTGWDTPKRLIPQIREEGALLMLCGNPIYFRDWHQLLEPNVPPSYHEIGRFENYVFYRVDGA